jgi:glycerol-1-phosphate dehydrogenase [NAD(P)+]
MNEILNLSISQMAGISFDCSCGRKHSVDIKRIVVGSGVMGDIMDIASDFREGSIFLISDNNTYRVYGSRVEEELKKNSFNVKSFVFETSHPLIPDEKALGRLFIEIEQDTSLIIAVGSGTINDLARMVSSRTKIPYISVATAPSMDGYALVVSPLIVEGMKKTFPAVYPYAIIADMDILKEAPMHMIHAGFGDILGKLTALSDWELTRQVNGEYYCDTIVELVRRAIARCIESADGILKRDETAI